jgi:hypothetical protein
VASGGPRLVWLHETERQASDWHRSGRDSGELLRGRALSHAQQWVADREESVPPLVREFVAAGAARNRRDRRIRRGVVAALSVVVIAAVMFGILARYQAAVSEAERASAASHSLSALSLSSLDSDPAWAIMLALAAHRSEPGQHTESALLQSYFVYRGATTVLSGASGSIEDVDASADGRVIAARSNGGVVTVWLRSPDKAPRVRHVLGTQTYDTDVAEDGSGILLIEKDKTSFYDIALGRKTWSVPVGGDQVRARINGADVAVQSADGEQGSIQLWRVDGGKPRLVGERKAAGTVVVEGFTSWSGVVLMDRDRGARSLTVWDAESGKVRRIGRELPADATLVGIRERAGGGSVSKDHVVTCTNDAALAGSTLARVSLRDGSVARTVDAPANCVGATAHGGSVVVISDGWLAVDLDSGTTIPLGGPHEMREASVLGVLINDGGGNSLVRYDPQKIVVQPVPSTPGTSGAQVLDGGRGILTPNGKHLITIGYPRSAEPGTDMPVMVTDTRDDRVVATAPVGMDVGNEPVDLKYTISQDGTLLAVAYQDDVVVRRLPDLKHLATFRREPPKEEKYLEPPRFVGDRLMIAHGARVTWWDPRTGKRVASLDLTQHGVPDDEADLVRIMPHARADRLAVMRPDVDEIRIVDRAGRTVDAVATAGPPEWVTFDRSGTYAAILIKGEGVVVLDLHRKKRVLGPILVQKTLAGNLPLIRFLDEPGRLVVASGPSLSYYRVGSERPERVLEVGVQDALPIVGTEPNQVVDVSGDGHMLAVKHGSTVDPVPMDPAKWRSTLCGVLGGREFTPSERAWFPEGVSDEPLC